MLGALKLCTSSNRSTPLDDGLIITMRKMADLLAATLRAEERTCLGEEEAEDVYLPDTGGRLYPVKELCLNDCEWLAESDTMHFLHTEFSEHLAIVFGVSTKREHDEVSALMVIFFVHALWI